MEIAARTTGLDDPRTSQLDHSYTEQITLETYSLTVLSLASLPQPVALQSRDK